MLLDCSTIFTANVCFAKKFFVIKKRSKCKPESGYVTLEYSKVTL